MVLLIDNYDSFVYNLARYVSIVGWPQKVVRNDAIDIAEIANLQPSHIIISPGPCAPDQAGISLALVAHFGSKIPILGVCLGHQVIGQTYGAKITRANKPIHGKSTNIQHQEKGIFKGLKNPLKVARYHSLIVSQEEIPEDLVITAISHDNEIMGLSHAKHPVYGVQFHPESIITQGGHTLLENFLTQSSL